MCVRLAQGLKSCALLTLFRLSLTLSLLLSIQRFIHCLFLTIIAAILKTFKMISTDFFSNIIVPCDNSMFHSLSGLPQLYYVLIKSKCVS